SNPSIVVIKAPLTSSTVTRQDRSARPSMCTVHEPHNPLPHPYFVPVSRRSSRITHKSGWSGGASAKLLWPLIVKLGMYGSLLQVPLWHGAASRTGASGGAAPRSAARPGSGRDAICRCPEDGSRFAERRLVALQPEIAKPRRRVSCGPPR